MADDRTIRTETEPIGRLREHGLVPISFTVESVFDVEFIEGGLGGVRLTERRLDAPWVKDYDAIVGDGPTGWAQRFNVEHWGLIAAYRADRRVGGAVVAFNTIGVDLLGGRADLAVLWDLRVRPEARAAGVGAALFGAARTWAQARSCRTLRVETQNINVPACRFYRRMGCTLASIDRFAYHHHLEEVQMIWQLEL